jgi:hypothetical protein
MEDSEKIQITIRIDKRLYEKIESLRKTENRMRSPQIEYMLKKYIEIREQ